MTDLQQLQSHFSLMGRCIGCGDSNQSYCLKHKQWAYQISNCGVEPKAKPVAGVVQQRTYESRPVLCITTGIEYPSLTYAARSLELPAGSIHQVCVGRHSHTKGLKFKFVDTGTPPPNVQKPVICKSTGERYESIKLAAESLGINVVSFTRNMKLKLPIFGKMYEVIT
jgi:hypothetical protein